jgi:xanthine dehydrogenase small subunit
VRHTVRFWLDDELIEVTDPAPELTVLEWLRGTRGRTGTKEGCAEGDCGACTVVLGEPSGDHIQYRAVNSCIRFLPTIDRMELITVESLTEVKQKGMTMHPVQRALIERHASQCGFCTPGFVMSLFALYLSNAAPEREQVVQAVCGNLCRCTGYRPIIDAGCAMASLPAAGRWSREDAQSVTRRERLERLQRDEPLAFPGFSAPTSRDELTRALLAAPDALLLAGGTDVGLWVTKQLRQLPALIYLGGVAELKQIDKTDAGLRIGAAVSLADAWPAIVELYPGIEELARRFASPPVCNVGTLCGNIANGSPVGDSLPLLLALDAQLTLQRGAVVRTLALDDFYLGYRSTALQAGEAILAVTLPLPYAGLRVASYKVAKRFEQDIAAVCAAFAIEVIEGRVAAARIAMGGMAAIPKRAPSVEAALIGEEWTLATVERVAQTIAQDFQPLSDLRASNTYRLTIAGNLLRRCYYETQSSAWPVRLDAVSRHDEEVKDAQGH